MIKSLLLLHITSLNHQFCIIMRRFCSSIKDENPIFTTFEPKKVLLAILWIQDLVFRLGQSIYPFFSLESETCLLRLDFMSGKHTTSGLIFDIALVSSSSKRHQQSQNLSKTAIIGDHCWSGVGNYKSKVKLYSVSSTTTLFKNNS